MVFMKSDLFKRSFYLTNKILIETKVLRILKLKLEAWHSFMGTSYLWLIADFWKIIRKRISPFGASQHRMNHYRVFFQTMPSRLWHLQQNRRLASLPKTLALHYIIMASRKWSYSSWMIRELHCHVGQRW